MNEKEIAKRAVDYIRAFDNPAPAKTDLARDRNKRIGDAYDKLKDAVEKFKLKT